MQGSTFHTKVIATTDNIHSHARSRFFARLRGATPRRNQQVSPQCPHLERPPDFRHTLGSMRRGGGHCATNSPLPRQQARKSATVPSTSRSTDRPSPPHSSQGSANVDRAVEHRRIAGRAGIVATGTLASRILGLVRDQVLAATFTRAVTDCFFVAFTIPNVLRQLLAEGAVQNAVLPVLTKVRETEGESATQELFRALRGLSWLLLTAVTIGGIVCAPELVALFAGGYRAHPGQFERTVVLTRWLFPYIFFMGTAAMGLAALNMHHRFVVTSFAPALLNVSFIICALALPGWLELNALDRALALAAGALLGGALQVLAQWPSLRAIGYAAWPTLRLHLPGVRETLRRMFPVLFGIGVYYIDVLLARRFLSELDTGAQSYFGWALRLCDFPQGIFVMALQSATLPSLATLAARGDLGELARTYAFAMRLALFVSIPATALFVGLAEPIVVMIFERGQFDAVSSHQTANALMAQGMGIWAVAAVRQLVGVYYALGDTRTPVLVASLDLLVFIGVALALRPILGHVGIGVAVTASGIVQMTLLWALLRRRLPTTLSAEIAGSALRTAAAAAPAALTAAVVAERVRTSLVDNVWTRLVPGAVGCLVFALVFFAFAWMVRSPELSSLWNAVRRRGARAGR